MNPTSSDYTSPYGYQYLKLLDTLGVLDTLPTSSIYKFQRPKDTGVAGVFNFQPITLWDILTFLLNADFCSVWAKTVFRLINTNLFPVTS